MVKSFVGLAVILCLALIVSCSGMNGQPLLPQNPSDSRINQTDESGRYLWGAWDLYFDVDAMTVEIIPSRELHPNWNVTEILQPPKCYDCISIKVNSFDPVTRIIDVDATLRNPSVFSGYDVRGTLYSNDVGHTLMNPDDWTPSYDVTGGMDINPFRAFAKSVALRKFLSGAKHTENYLVKIPDPPLFGYIKYAVTANWPGNAKDPYQIDNFTQEEISSELTSSGVVSVDVSDWQNDIGTVWLYAPEINGVEYIEMNHITGDTWQANVVNTEGTAAGDYTVKVKAVSTNAVTLPLYDFFTITITPKPPPKGWGLTWGGTSGDDAWDVAVDASGNAYVVGSFQGTADLDPHPSVDDHVSNGLMDAYLIKISNAGIYQWGLSWGSTNQDISKAVTVDSAGNIYVTGSFYGTLDFDPGTGVEDRTSNGGSDVFLSKFSSDGELIWVGTWGGGDSNDSGLDIVTDNNNNICIVGYTSPGIVDFDPGPGETIPPSVTRDAFLSIFDSDCIFQWAGRWGTIILAAANGVAVDNNGNIYVTGFYVSYPVDLDPGPGSDIHSNSGLSDVFLSKFDLDGNYQWGRTWGSESSEIGLSVAVYGTNNIYIRGDFSGTVDFDPGPDADNHTSIWGSDDFLSKFDSAGNFQWADTWDGNNANDPLPRISANSLGDVIVAGDIYLDAKPVDLDPGPGVDEYYTSQYDGFISYFNPAGEYQWARVIGPIGNQFNTGVITDASNYIYVVGYFDNKIELDPGPDIDEHTTNGNYDAFIVKYDPNGNW
jgi:hypothetical protein